MTAMRTIIRAATKKENEPYNIITLLDENIFPYVAKLSETGNKFYFWESVNDTKWNDTIVMKPDNFSSIKGQSMPEHLDFDVVLCPNRGFFQFCKNISDFWHIPIVLLESQIPTDEYKQFNQQEWLMTKQYEGDINVFVSNEARDEWEQLGYVIPKDGDNFCDSWNNVLQESCSLVYTRM